MCLRIKDDFLRGADMFYLGGIERKLTMKSFRKEREKIVLLSLRSRHLERRNVSKYVGRERTVALIIRTPEFKS